MYDLLHGPRQSNLQEGGRFATYDEALQAAERLDPQTPWIEIDEVLDAGSRRTVAAWKDGIQTIFLANPPVKEIPLPPAGPRSRPSALAERLPA